MPKTSDLKIYRAIDANFNRAKEGLRVCEDVCRFVLDKPYWTKQFKMLRHKLNKTLGGLKFDHIVDARNIEGDVGRSSSRAEFKRNQIKDIFYANAARVKESVRVLEEFVKLFNRRYAQELKEIRYSVYALEKKIAEQL